MDCEWGETPQNMLHCDIKFTNFVNETLEIARKMLQILGIPQAVSNFHLIFTTNIHKFTENFNVFNQEISSLLSVQKH